MSENSENKGFRTLKLTSLKTAKPAEAPSTEAPMAADESGAPAAPATPTLRPALLKADAAEPSSASAAGTPPPTLSPSAASTGPVLKPFKVLTPMTKLSDEPAQPAGEPSHAKPQEIKLTKAGSGLSAVPVVPPELPPVSEGPSAVALPPELPSTESAPAEPVKKVSLAKPAEAPKAAVPAKAPVAAPSRKPLVIVGVLVVLLVLAGGGVALSLHSGDKKSVESAPKTPVADTPESKTPEATTPTAATTPESTTTGATTPVATGVKPESTAVVTGPRTRKAEVEAWLKDAAVTTVATHRVTLNGKVYALNTIVNEEAKLRWIGRDTVTKDLLFMDDVGVIYNKPTTAR